LAARQVDDSCVVPEDAAQTEQHSHAGEVRFVTWRHAQYIGGRHRVGQRFCGTLPSRLLPVGVASRFSAPARVRQNSRVVVFGTSGATEPATIVLPNGCRPGANQVGDTVISGRAATQTGSSVKLLDTVRSRGTLPGQLLARGRVTAAASASM